MSYSSITKKQTFTTIVEEDTLEYKEQQHIEEYKEYKEQQSILNNKKNKYKKHNEDAYNMTVNMTSSNNVSGAENSSMLIIQPRVLNIYNKKYCMRWLTYNINDNYYHYDYCVRLFEIIMKWVRYNNFVLKTNEQVLLGKFMSLMYLLSNKKGYSYDK